MDSTKRMSCAILLVLLGALAVPLTVGAAWVDQGDGTVRDTVTGLFWQKSDDGVERSWENALSYCEGLNLGGKGDWRLPNIRELANIVDDSRSNPACDPVFSCRSDYYWSGSTYAEYPSNAWGVHFFDVPKNVDVGLKHDEYYYVRCVRGGPSGPIGPLTIGQTPMSGPPGTTFVQWGTGFTPNGMATLHFKKPDSTDYPIVKQQIDAFGRFQIEYMVPFDAAPGSYTWWAIDDARLKQSNEVTYGVDNATVVTGDFDLSNVSTRANEFQLWLDVSINGQANDRVCDEYHFVVEAGGRTAARQDGCMKVGVGKTENSTRYRTWFVVDPNDPGHPTAAYFEDGMVYMTPKSNPANRTALSGLTGFNIYGTTFDMKRHAFRFRNSEWDRSNNQHKVDELIKAVDTLTSYLSPHMRYLWWGIFWQKFDWAQGGVCYGMAGSCSANFNHQGEPAWGVLDKGKSDQKAWKEAIDDHWSEDENRALTFKPFAPDEIYNKSQTYDSNHKDDNDRWTLEAARKAAYYHLSQCLCKFWRANNSSWIGRDSKPVPFDNHQSHKDFTAKLLKNGRPGLLSGNLEGIYNLRRGKWVKVSGSHVVITPQLITWNYNGDHKRFMIYDNNVPYPLLEQFDLGPYPVWEWDQQTFNRVALINTVDAGHWTNDNFRWKGLPNFLAPGCGDSQNVYNLWDQSCDKGAGTSAPGQEGSATIFTALEDPVVEHSYPNHIVVMLLGTELDQVVLKETGAPVAPVPFGEVADGLAVREVSPQGLMTVLYLPTEGTYRIDATRSEVFSTVKIFVSIPEGDGSVEVLNYETFAAGEENLNRFMFFVGRQNTDKAIRRSVQPHGGLIAAADDLYDPDYDGRGRARVAPPLNFRAIYSGGVGKLSWNNTSFPHLKEVRVVRSDSGPPSGPEDGTSVYQGLLQNVDDGSVAADGRYYYAAFSVDNDGYFSDPAHAHLDTWLYSISGRVSQDGGSALSGAQLVLKTTDGKTVDTTSSGPDGNYTLANLENNYYVLEASHGSYAIVQPVRNVALSAANQVIDFEGVPVPALELLLEWNEVSLGDSVLIRWTYRHLDDEEQAVIMLGRDEYWETLATNVRLAQGQLPWLAEGAPTEGALMRMCLSNGSGVCAEHTFKIKEPASLKVASPNGGETWYRGTTQTIAWTHARKPAEKVKIVLCKGGAAVKTIATAVPIGIDGKGSRNWTIPENLTPGDDYEVRIVSTSCSSCADVSDGTFSVKTPGAVAVLAPNGDENWQVGSRYAIGWMATVDIGPSARIELLKADTVVKTIALNALSGGVGKHSFPWKVPNTLAYGNDYRIRVSGNDNPAHTDTSDKMFVISGPTLDITAPDGGENWAKGSRKNITWTYTGSPGGTVKIQLLKAGTPIRTLASGLAVGSGGMGAFPWTIPADLQPRSNYRIKVTHNAVKACTSISSGNFSISESVSAY